jgi:2-polyprenyl-3-methyl-5-hydroxy-6-metoxy-1,4-benzoquinol methylase
MSQQYRALFYKNYFTQQVGRFQGEESTSKLAIESLAFTKEIVPLLGSNIQSSILDIGCGFGSFIDAAKKKGYTNIKGIDTSSEQVAIAHQLGLNEVEQADVFSYLQSCSNQFDTITALDVIEHFTKDEAVSVLRAVFTALKPGGKLIIRTPNADAPLSTVYLYGDFTHELYLNASSAHQLLATCGYVNVAIQKGLTTAPNPIKRLLQKLSWGYLQLLQKWKLFATARTTKGAIFTPNLVAIAQKPIS